MLDKLTKKQFEAVLGSEFVLGLGEEGEVKVTLTAVDDVVSPGSVDGWGHDGEVIRSQSFALVFRGPHEPVWGQGIFAMTHPELGELPGIFLVPVAQDDDGRYYEAVFN